MLRIGGLTLGTVILALSAGIASAGMIDQQNTATNSFLGPSASPGQSFTPTLTNIDFATFELESSDVEDGAPVYATLFQGAGYGGTVLGSSTNVASVFNGSSFSAYTFNFNPIALTPGSVYTLELIDTAGQTLYEQEASGDQYAGGVEYGSTGLADTGYDLTFSEGGTQAQTPEPATFWTLFAGLAVMIAFMRRRTRSGC